MNRRTLLGFLFVLHGLAHSGLGMWAAVRGPDWYVVPLWWFAEVGFIVGGLGVLGIPWCRRVWEPAVAVAALSSILLLQWFGNVTLALGLLLDTIIIVLGLHWGESALVQAARSGRTAGARSAGHTSRHPLLVLAGTAFVLYVAAVIPMRSWYLRWGTTAADRLATPSTPSLRNTMLAPARLLLIEPIHIVVERRMLLGIEAHAEHSRRST